MAICMNMEAYENMIWELRTFIEEVNMSCEVIKNAANMCREIKEDDYATAKAADRLFRSAAHYQEAVEAAYQLMEQLSEERMCLIGLESKIEEN